MVAPIEIPSEYGYVLLAAFSTFIVGVWNGTLVSRYRRKAKIPYPYEYASFEQITAAPPAKADDMLLFNCAQRSHQNFNENHVSAVGAMMISGLAFPRTAAIMGGIWSVNRVIYALGYTNGVKGGSGRYNGAAWMLMHYGMIGLAGKTLFDIVKP